MSYERFTDRARKVMQYAHQEALRFNHEYVGTEHILLGLIKEGTGVAAIILKKMGIDLRKLRLEVEKLVASGPDTVTMGRLPQTPRAKKAVEYAIEEARELKHSYVGTEHLLLGLLKEHDGVAAQVLMNLNLKLEDVREEVLATLGEEGGADLNGSVGNDDEEDDSSNGSQDSPKSGSGRSETSTRPGKSKTPALDSFGRDLTQLAREKKLDPVVGRENEIERAMQILCRRTKNNPVLLGEAGVGKTAIVEGLAQRVVEGKVPEILMDRRIVVLDLAMMVAGTKYRGQFEERIKALMNEVKRTKNVILFIDELHTLVGAGGAEGAIDAANVLKPALSRGEIQCIGATTFDEYRKYVEKDNALERRFQSVIVNPTTTKETIAILKGLRERYEKHHRVTITDEAIESAVELSERYISGRCLPDKAIDVIDEAGARVRLKKMTRPPDVNELDRLSEELLKQKDAAVAKQDFEAAATLRDKLDGVRVKKEQLQKEWREKLQKSDGVVDAAAVSEVVSKITGVPLTRLTVEDSKRLVLMEETLHKRVVSQQEAISAISKAVRRSRSGIQDPKRPIGSFIFAGPTGVGKTLLAKALAEFMFGDEDALVQIDMSEYMEKYNVSRLVGAPPGYVGHDEGGQLTEKIRRRPYSVVLLDEIEKAHPDVFNILLQVLEEGRLTDSYGRVVDFRNTILIMTTNAGADAIKNESAFGFQRPDDDSSYAAMKQRVNDSIERVFRPEFINRFNDIIVFRHLTEKDLIEVVEMELKKLRTRLKDKNLCLTITDDAKKLIVKRGSNVEFGARPLRRAIESNLEDALSEDLLNGTFEGFDVVAVDVKDEPREEGKADAQGADADARRKKLFFTAKKFADLTPEELDADEIKNFRTDLKKTTEAPVELTKLADKADAYATSNADDAPKAETETSEEKAE